MQRDNESPLLLFLLYLEDNSVTFKSYLMNHRQSGDLTDDLVVVSSQTHPGCGKCADIRSIVILMVFSEKRTLS